MLESKASGLIIPRKWNTTDLTFLLGVKSPLAEVAPELTDDGSAMSTEKMMLENHK
jgi:hypothetical protein